MKANILLFATLATLVFSACIKDKVDNEIKHYTEDELAKLQKTLNLTNDMEDYTLDIPAHLGGFPVNANDHQATLGRVLFYDTKLSVNGKVSCASCHKADKAFADDVAFSEGFQGELTERNSIALGAFPSFNAYYGFASGGGTRLFWDERAGSVVEQSEATLKNPIEMGHTDLNALYDQLIKEDYYEVLFAKAFPQENNFTNKGQKILTAIQAFVNTIGCFNTRYDQELAKNNDISIDFPGFSDAENIGKSLFNSNCATCHNLGSGFSTTVAHANNGLDMDYIDRGIGGVSKQNHEDGVFKVPMLRNVALTAPFMHDGRFATLEEVVEHYSTGVKDHPNLHQNLLTVNGQPRNLNLTSDQKFALVAFLHTLTDQESVTQEKYLDPFK